MANMQIYYNFLSYTPTALNEDPVYVLANLDYYENTKQQYRTTTINAGEWIKFDLGSLKTIKGIFINDCNFASATIQIATTDSWTSPDRYNQTPAVANDTRVSRYKHLCNPALSQTTRYVRILPLGTVGTDGLSVYRMGTVVIAGSMLELYENPDYPYNINIKKAINTIAKESGGAFHVPLGPQIWECSFGFELYEQAYESDFWTLNSITEDQNMVFFENCAYTQHAYLCRRSPIQVSWVKPSYVSLQTLTLTEIGF